MDSFGAASDHHHPMHLELSWFGTDRTERSYHGTEPAPIRARTLSAPSLHTTAPSRSRAQTMLAVPSPQIVQQVDDNRKTSVT